MTRMTQRQKELLLELQKKKHAPEGQNDPMEILLGVAFAALIGVAVYQIGAAIQDAFQLGLLLQ